MISKKVQVVLMPTPKDMLAHFKYVIGYKHTNAKKEVKTDSEIDIIHYITNLMKSEDISDIKLTVFG